LTEAGSPIRFGRETRRAVHPIFGRKQIVSEQLSVSENLIKGIQMKFITSLFAATGLVCGTLAFAQDASTPPSGLSLEKKAPATTEATPETTPEPKSSIWSSPEPVEKPTPPSTTVKKKKKDTPTATTASEKKAQAAPSASKTEAAPAAAKAGKKRSVESSLKDLENTWEASIPNHDAAAVEPLVASDFSGVSSKGKFTSKSSLLKELKNDKDTYTYAKNEKLNVHLYGSNVAVVTGSAREKGTAKDGTAFDRTYRFTDTWMDRDGQWQIVGSQVMLVPGK
jgi:ketosteroid isomerase-like protein